MNKIITAIVSFLCAANVSAQNGANIKGKLIGINASPIAYATIIAYTAQDSSVAKAAFSDEQGNFLLAPLSANKYWIRVEFSEMATYRSEVIEVGAGESVKLETITMQEKEVDMAKVNIYAQKPLIEVKPDMTVFNVSGTINSIGENAFELLRKAPGVIVDNSDNIILMGKSGVSIYIDGKRSPLSIADLATMLKGMQSSQIESIEIITNPSARYDAEGNAGIINIRLKKDKSLGTQGSITGGYGIGRFSKWDGGLNFNSRNKVVNVFGNYSGNQSMNYSYSNFFRRQNGFEVDQRNDFFDEGNSNNVKVGADFFLDKEHTIGVMYSGFFSDKENRNISLTPISLLASNEVQSILDAQTLGESNNSSQTFNLNYAYKNKAGNSWNLDADYGRYRLRNETLQPNLYLNPETDEVERDASFATGAPRDIDIYTFKADHQRKLFGGTFSTGLKSAYIETDNTFNFSDFHNGEEVLNQDRSNNFVYKENINALYASFRKRIGQKWNWNLGLRAEHTWTNGELVSLQNTELDSVKRSYLNLFPSGGLTFSPNRINSFSLNYSRRIDRPRYQDLNPFLTQIDQITFSQGNPFLRPQFSHSVQLNYTYQYRYTASLSYTLTNDYFTRLTDILSEDASFIILENLESREVISANISAPIAINKRWNTYTNLNISRTQNRGDFNEAGETGKGIDIARTTANLYQQHTVTLTENVSLEISGFYSSPSIWGANYLTREFWGVNGGALFRMFNKKATLKLSVNDIFYSMQWQGTQEFGGLFYDASGGYESRQFRANFTFNFGNDKVRASRKRKTGMQAESKRLQSGGQGN
ncbi:MAG: TonB-dependent receptor [Bacteroidota bacterium]